MGRLADGHDRLDALAACFPAGTVSGAPKIRAMEILADLEHHGLIGLCFYDTGARSFYSTKRPIQKAARPHEARGQ